MIGWFFGWLRKQLHLDVLEAQLASLQREKGIPTPIPPRDLDCGHRSSSYATYEDGRTHCLACHQEAP